jgi:hypothetical protein
LVMTEIISPSPSAEMSYTGAEVSSIRSTFPVAVSDCIPFLVVPFLFDIERN